jgi:hypothetical protein
VREALNRMPQSNGGVGISPTEPLTADVATDYPEISRLIHVRALRFPIETKKDFIEQMVSSGEVVMFCGVAYNTRFGAGLMPNFFFPLQSAEDLITKAVELVVSRGLLPLPPFLPLPDPRPVSWQSAGGSEKHGISDVMRWLERLVRDRPESGKLDPDTALAFDIVTHALEFTGIEDGLSLWREMLWRRTLPEQARVAVVRLLEYVISAAARGEMDVIDEICGCLRGIVDGSGFAAPARHMGGNLRMAAVTEPSR